MTGDHSLIYARLQMAEVRPGYAPLGVAALAERLRCSRATAARTLAATVARQHDPAVLRVVQLPVPTGKGARRMAWHILWPVSASLTQQA